MEATKEITTKYNFEWAGSKTANLAKIFERPEVSRTWQWYVSSPFHSWSSPKNSSLSRTTNIYTLIALPFISQSHQFPSPKDASRDILRLSGRFLRAQIAQFFLSARIVAARPSSFISSRTVGRESSARR